MDYFDDRDDVFWYWVILIGFIIGSLVFIMVGYNWWYYIKIVVSRVFSFD